jgi:hypothetical protein
MVVRDSRPEKWAMAPPADAANRSGTMWSASSGEQQVATGL